MPTSSPGRPIRRTAANLLLALGAVAAVLAALEAGFRLVPALVPAGVYAAYAPSPELGLNVHAAPALYRRVRTLVRTPNALGFMDREHAESKPEGTTRVGFFGDSYVESLMVPLEGVFFSRLADRLADERVETLGFGMSGWGTVQALYAYQHYARRFALDAAVYVFVENDPGDQSWEIATASGAAGPGLLYAELAETPEGYRIRRTREPGEEPVRERAVKALHARSRLFQLVRSRLAGLGQAGVQLQLDPEAAAMSGVAGRVPVSTDLPSTWPDEARTRTEALGERVLRDWQRRARADGIELVVLYVPRSEEQLTGRIRLEDTWQPWLAATCASLGLELIDPSDALRARLAAGDRVYDDHWAPAGHEAVADVLAGRFGATLAGASAARRSAAGFEAAHDDEP